MELKESHNRRDYFQWNIWCTAFIKHSFIQASSMNSGACVSSCLRLKWPSGHLQLRSWFQMLHLRTQTSHEHMTKSSFILLWNIKVVFCPYSESQWLFWMTLTLNLWAKLWCSTEERDSYWFASKWWRNHFWVNYAIKFISVKVWMKLWQISHNHS